MNQLSRQAPADTRRSSSDAGWLRRISAKCGFELNYTAAGLFVAGIVILVFGIHSVISPH
ncbi:hypothetical protein [Telmatospirillum siberiense]|uniref:Uncharacterized protein n=1 Tax=Telmatospirillum siberiense TaxID=382514 RepID=A0A2N3PX45_9PROT|nr:hypothetical protein [Telmatospirillum siberiense]PKU24983.1 hypothetical protein CWS72_08960 [Telmatospirillum siberiense]